MGLEAWMDRNLATQGYCLSAHERRRLAVGLRFSTGLCLGLTASALALRSAPMLLALATIGLAAGFSQRHPFDHLWNHGVRRVLGTPPVPPSPPRRRHAFKLATAWLVCVAALVAAGLTTAALVLGMALLAACAMVTAFNLCIPSIVIATWERRRVGEYREEAFQA